MARLARRRQGGILYRGFAVAVDAFAATLNVAALYGSDAIAGVINFKTKKDYQGAEFQVNFDHPQEPGGGSGVADFTFGHGDLASDGYSGRFRDPQGNRLPWLSGAYAQQLVRATSIVSVEQRQHGTRETVP
jgi:hypothetical protein